MPLDKVAGISHDTYLSSYSSSSRDSARCISASTSAGSRLKLSMAKAYTVTRSMQWSDKHMSSTRFSVSNPTLCPSCTRSPLLRDQRRFPSIINAICRGSGPRDSDCTAAMSRASQHVAHQEDTKPRGASRKRQSLWRLTCSSEEAPSASEISADDAVVTRSRSVEPSAMRSTEECRHSGKIGGPSVSVWRCVYSRQQAYGA